MDNKKYTHHTTTHTTTPEELQEAALTQYGKINSSDWKEQTLLDYWTCCLCGTDLKFVQTTNFAQQTVDEESHCPSCQIKSKKSVYTLQ